MDKNGDAFDTHTQSWTHYTQFFYTPKKKTNDKKKI